MSISHQYYQNMANNGWKRLKFMESDIGRI